MGYDDRLCLYVLNFNFPIESVNVVVRLVSCCTYSEIEVGWFVIVQNKKLEMNCGADGLYITLTLLYIYDN